MTCRVRQNKWHQRHFHRHYKLPLSIPMTCKNIYRSWSRSSESRSCSESCSWKSQLLLFNMRMKLKLYVICFIQNNIFQLNWIDWLNVEVIYVNYFISHKHVDTKALSLCPPKHKRQGRYVFRYSTTRDNQSINQSKQIYIAPCVASES